MDQDIRPRTTKPKIRLVQVKGRTCKGCINREGEHGPCHKLPVRCIDYPNAHTSRYFHIKHVGEHPSTR